MFVVLYIKLKNKTIERSKYLKKGVRVRVWIRARQLQDFWTRNQFIEHFLDRGPIDKIL